jgi:multidrug efflux pump subunit AcrA (membrane-fusion protein)
MQAPRGNSRRKGLICREQRGYSSSSRSVARRDARRSTAQGTIGVEETDIVPTVGGRIRRIWIAEGAQVHADDTVVTLVSSTLPDDLRERKARVAMTYYLAIVRSIALKGVGLAETWQPALILTAFAALLVIVSVKRFTKTME